MLRRGEDAYVDELIAPTSAFGVTLLFANYPRSYIDLNRDEDDIDEALLDAPWPHSLNPSEKTRMGLGLIRRNIVPGAPIYGRKLTVAEVQRRLEDIYVPYHRALSKGLDDLQREFGFVWHINWHSMKSLGNTMTPDGPGAPRPDFVVGDLDGKSASAEFASLVIEVLRGRGYSVSHNNPYKGATIVHRYGRRNSGFHTLQIEVNRALYLDEAKVEKNSDFDAVRASIVDLVRRLQERLQ
jgi:N-formylglutamate deformylase